MTQEDIEELEGLLPMDYIDPPRICIGEPIVNQNLDFFNKVFRTPSLVTLTTHDSYKVVSDFDIELEDDEEFDPTKLQLFMTFFELHCVQWGILPYKIMYNGKIYETKINDFTDGMWLEEM